MIKSKQYYVHVLTTNAFVHVTIAYTDYVFSKVREGISEYVLEIMPVVAKRQVVANAIPSS